jgi:oligo-alginate lyase
VRASSPAQIKGSAYERTIAMVETGPDDYYVFDVFRVAGGTDHAKHTRSTFTTPTVFGLQLAPSPSLHDAGTLMRAFQGDRRPAPGWGVDWKVEDKHGYLDRSRDLHLRYTDLTRGAEAYTAESWTVASATSSTEYWIPTIVARRHAESGPLESTFVSLLDPYEGQPQLRRAVRLDREGDPDVRVEVELAGGLRDVLTSGPAGVRWERRNAAGRMVFSGAATGR